MNTQAANVGSTPISVIIPVRNEGDRIAKTVRSVVQGRSCSFPLEIVVVDDASSDGACDRLEDAIGDAPQTSLTVLRLASWSGIPFARNRGAQAAHHPVLFITDGNTRFPQDWDAAIRPRFARGRILAATILDLASAFRGFGCQLMLPSMAVIWLGRPDAYAGYAPISACTGTVIEREVFEALGGYDETLPLYGAAEPELSLRAWLSGYEIVSAPELCIQHRFRPRAEHDAFLADIAAVQLRNYLRFAAYYLPDEQLSRTCDFYARRHPDDFGRVWAELYAGDVWERRARLRQLPRDFGWFAEKFPLIRQEEPA
jgi:glycosyltransferase involved in cell wall biosynthesis